MKFVVLFESIHQVTGREGEEEKRETTYGKSPLN